MLGSFYLIFYLKSTFLTHLFLSILLIDTAGIRNTDDIVENIGVEKSKELINSADLILYVIDTSREIDEEDYRIYDIINTDKVIGILNKIDIKKDIDLSRFPKIEKWCKNCRNWRIY